MTDASGDHGGLSIRFAGDVGGFAGEEEGLVGLVERLGEASAACAMEP